MKYACPYCGTNDSCHRDTSLFEVLTCAECRHQFHLCDANHKVTVAAIFWDIFGYNHRTLPSKFYCPYCLGLLNLGEMRDDGSYVIPILCSHCGIDMPDRVEPPPTCIIKPVKPQERVLPPKINPYDTLYKFINDPSITVLHEQFFCSIYEIREIYNRWHDDYYYEFTKAIERILPQWMPKLEKKLTLEQIDFIFKLHDVKKPIFNLSDNSIEPKAFMEEFLNALEKDTTPLNVDFTLNLDKLERKYGLCNGRARFQKVEECLGMLNKMQIFALQKKIGNAKIVEIYALHGINFQPFNI